MEPKCFIVNYLVWNVLLAGIGPTFVAQCPILGQAVFVWLEGLCSLGEYKGFLVQGWFKDGLGPAAGRVGVPLRDGWGPAMGLVPLWD